MRNSFSKQVTEIHQHWICLTKTEGNAKPKWKGDATVKNKWICKEISNGNI